MTIEIGVWGVPALISLVILLALIIWERRQPPAYDYGAIGAGVISFFAWLFGLVAVLIV